jgi:carboxypeptidase Taq
VDADEMTYPLHVILRFELEKAMIEGSLSVEDLPGAWNEKMTKYLSLSTLDNDKDGCMQDVHWPGGALGYFPAYTFGALTAAQLFATLKKLHPHIQEDIRNGDFHTVTGWLKENVWANASLYSSEELIKRATGQDLNPTFFIEHLKERYL